MGGGHYGLARWGSSNVREDLAQEADVHICNTAEDTPSFDYGGFVVGEQEEEAVLLAKKPVRAMGNVEPSRLVQKRRLTSSSSGSGSPRRRTLLR